MIKKYTFGTPFPTESIFVPVEPAQGRPEHGEINLDDGFTFTFHMDLSLIHI